MRAERASGSGPTLCVTVRASVFSPQHCVEFRASGERRWLHMLRTAFYIIERASHSLGTEETKEPEPSSGLAPVEPWTYAENLSLNFVRAQSIMYHCYGRRIQVGSAPHRRARVPAADLPCVAAGNGAQDARAHLRDGGRQAHRGRRERLPAVRRAAATRSEQGAYQTLRGPPIGLSLSNARAPARRRLSARSI